MSKVNLQILQYINSNLTMWFSNFSEIFCHGELLHTVQMSRINADSKTFVDMKLRQSPNITLDNFRIWQSQHPEPSQNDVRAFVQVRINKQYENRYIKHVHISIGKF